MPAIAMDIAKPTICGSEGLAGHNMRGSSVEPGAAVATIFDDKQLMDAWARRLEEWGQREPKSADDWEMMDGRRSRIDAERSKYNYALKALVGGTYEKEARRVLEKAKAEGRVKYRIVGNDRIPPGKERGLNAGGKRGQNSRATVFFSQIATLPEGMPLELAPAYFRAVYDFWAKEVGGEEFILSAHVHLDETTPHLHVCALPMVPCVTPEGKGLLKLSSKDFWNEMGGGYREVDGGKKVGCGRDSYSAAHDKIYLHLTGAGFDVERGVVGGKRKYYKMSELREGARELDELREKLAEVLGNVRGQEEVLKTVEGLVDKAWKKHGEQQALVEEENKELERIRNEFDSELNNMLNLQEEVIRLVTMTEMKRKEFEGISAEVAFERGKAIRAAEAKLTEVEGKVDAKNKELERIRNEFDSELNNMLNLWEEILECVVNRF